MSLETVWWDERVTIEDPFQSRSGETPIIKKKGNIRLHHASEANSGKGFGNHVIRARSI